MKIIDNIKKRLINKKIIELRREIKNLRNIITAILFFVEDRKYMDQRNLDRAIEIESVHNCNGRTPEKSYYQTEGIISELKDSIAASNTLLSQMNMYKSSSKDYNTNLF